MALPTHGSRGETSSARGFRLGVAMREQVAESVRTYKQMFAELGMSTSQVLDAGERMGAEIGRWRPALLDEITGIAAGARESESWLLAINGRSELVAAGMAADSRSDLTSECSVVGLAGCAAGRVLLAQTWDFHPATLRSRVIWTVDTDSDGSWATFTEAGILAKTGLSGKGLAVTINFLPSKPSEDYGVVPVHLLVRAMLEESDTVDDAITVASTAEVGASVCLTVASRRDSINGRLAALEVTPRGVAVVKPERGRLAHTNHLIAAPLAGGLVNSNSLERLARLRRLTAEIEPQAAMGLGQLLDVLSSKEGLDSPIFRQVPTAYLNTGAADPMVCHEPNGALTFTCVATLATIAYDVDCGSMVVRDGLSATDPWQAVVCLRG